MPRNNQNNVSAEINLNVSTPQDLLVDIGSPLRTFFKEEDKLRIHSEDSSVNDSIESSDGGNLNSSLNGVEGRYQEGGNYSFYINLQSYEIISSK